MKKLSVLLLCLSTALSLHAQNWGGGVDEERIHFGFSFQYLVSEFKIDRNANWRAPFVETLINPNPSSRQITNELNALASKPTMGFGLGLVMDGRLHKNVNLRFTPGIIFSDRVIDYQYYEPSSGQTPQYPAISMQDYQIQKKVQATMAEFPLGVKLRADRRMNFRPYLLAGAKYSMDLGSRKKTDDEGQPAIEKYLKNKKSYLSYEAAIGFDLYFEHFKMTPEIKLSYTPNSILSRNYNAFDTPIDKLRLRTFTFSLFFE